MPFYGGSDWGGIAHAVCVVDGAGQVIARIEARHDEAGPVDMLARLRKIAPSTELPIAIERPSGLVVDALIKAGHPVIPIHPNVVKACRPRYRAAGGKSDPGDAYMLADVLRTDGHRFRPLRPMADEIKALRALVRGRDDLMPSIGTRNNVPAARSRGANDTTRLSSVHLVRIAGISTDSLEVGIPQWP